MARGTALPLLSRPHRGDLSRPTICTDPVVLRTTPVVVAHSLLGDPARRRIGRPEGQRLMACRGGSVSHAYLRIKVAVGVDASGDNTGMVVTASRLPWIPSRGRLGEQRYRAEAVRAR